MLLIGFVVVYATFYDTVLMITSTDEGKMLINYFLDPFKSSEKNKLYKKFSNFGLY